MSDTIVTQEDINMFSQMFSKLSNIIVQASEVGRELPQLRSEIASLRTEGEDIRKRNAELDELLHTTRQQRDEAQSKVHALTDLADQRLHEVQDITRDRDFFKSTCAADAIEMNNLKKERDDYGFRNMELQDQLDKANATLAKFRELLGNAGVSTPTPSVQDPSPTVIVAEPEAKPTTKRIYRYDNVALYEHEYHTNNRERKWDDVAYDYYVEVAA